MSARCLTSHYDSFLRLLPSLRERFHSVCSVLVFVCVVLFARVPDYFWLPLWNYMFRIDSRSDVKPEIISFSRVCFHVFLPGAWGFSSVCMPACSLWPHWLWHTRLLCPWDSPGKNTGVGGHSLLQGIFPTLGSNPYLPNYRWILYPWATWEAHSLSEMTSVQFQGM